MLEALWTLEFISLDPSLPNWGRGVVIFETERVFGGDYTFYYVGKYKVTGTRVEIEAEIINYGEEPNSIFGLNEQFTVKVSGEIKNPMYLDGYMVEDPNQMVRIKCTRRADLP